MPLLARAARDEAATYYEWDVATWSRSLPVWKAKLDEAENTTQGPLTCLEIGARGGGLTRLLAKSERRRVVCTDINEGAFLAREGNSTIGPLERGRIEYCSANVLELPFRDCSFDIAVFKSVLGALGTFEAQQRAVAELRRVLRPGGSLLFAENLEASALHRAARQRFVPWARYWRYVTLDDMASFLSEFSQTNLNSTGLSAAFVTKARPLERAASSLDRVIESLAPARWRYVCFGWAVR
jgi:ubiquinone/menaquinone biosynthesis C-methylase UbiE